MLVARANEYRVASGVPELSSDPLIAQAALNHSNYWSLNTQGGDPLGLHLETPGNPGYTGKVPPERCAAVGASCGSEVMVPGAAGAKAVDLLMSTVYHRQLTLSATETAAGGAWSASNLTTIDFQGGSSSVLARPAGFPVGEWDGPLAMIAEAPDPIAYCNAQSSAPPLSAPVGTPITWQLPAGGEALSVAVRSASDGQALGGCSDLEPGVFGSYFIPARPLQPATEYEVTLLWRPAPSATAEVAGWQFRTSASPPVVPGSIFISPTTTAASFRGTDSPEEESRRAGHARLLSARIRQRGTQRRLVLRMRIENRSAIRAALLRGSYLLAGKSFPAQAPGTRTLMLSLGADVIVRNAIVRLVVLDEQTGRLVLRQRL